MSGFLYFLPGLDRPPTLEDVAAAGIGHAFESHKEIQHSPLVGRTPTGSLGMLVFCQARMGDAPPGYRPELQTWRQIPGSPAHVGYYRDAQPNSTTLARDAAHRLDGAVLKLADGGEWLIPKLKAFAGESGWEPLFPLVARLDDDGNWISGGATPAAIKLNAMFDELYDHMTGDGISTTKALDTAAELLGVNYVVSRVEVSLIGVLDTGPNLHRILTIAADWDAAMEWAQKKTMESGPADAAG